MKSSTAAFYEGNCTIVTGESQEREPGVGEVRIKVAFCGVCGTDLHIFHGAMDQRVRLPQIIGHEMSGVIESLGPEVADWKIGDQVTVRPVLSCGSCETCASGNSHVCPFLKFMGTDTPGAMQGLWTVPAHTLHRIPAELSLQQAALIEPLAAACHDVKRGSVTKSDTVAILGCGPIGISIALVAKTRGARVILSEINPFRLKIAAEFGFETINPKAEDLIDQVRHLTGEAGADVVFEVSDVATSVEALTKIVKPRARLEMVAIHPKPVMMDLFQFFWKELSLAGARLYQHEDFDEAIALASSGALPLERMVSRVLPLAQLQDALHSMEQGGDVLNVLIECAA